MALAGSSVFNSVQLLNKLNRNTKKVMKYKMILHFLPPLIQRLQYVSPRKLGISFSFNDWTHLPTNLSALFHIFVQSKSKSQISIGWKIQVGSFHLSIVHGIGNHHEKPLKICTDIGWKLTDMGMMPVHAFHQYQTSERQIQGKMSSEWKRDTLVVS